MNEHAALDVLADKPQGDPGAWRPWLYSPNCDRHLDALKKLVDAGMVSSVHDTIDEQLRELVAIRDPRQTWPLDELNRRVRQHLGGRDARRYGIWAYFPWSCRLVHLLPVAEFREVRTDRNRYKITSTEQARLSRLRIGIVGLSVGNAAAVTLALEGIGAAFKLADFDQLSLSNLNRLRCGVHDLGVDKTLLTARALFEIDPWLDIEVHMAGVQPDTVDEFLAGGAKLDVVIEECDDLGMKVLVRERAREHGISVIMDTSDRGLIDIERFDREPRRPILHGLIGAVRAEQLRAMTVRDKVPTVLNIIDEQRISTRMAASLPEIATTIGSWPQLASGVALGGALIADATRRITLGELSDSGRFYVDPAEIVGDGRGTYREPADPPPPFEVSDESRRPAQLPPEPDRPQAASLDVAAVRWIAAVGALAPSAHNNQPWQLRWRGGDRVLECRHDPARDLPSLDFEHRATWLAFGALIENICMAARHVGLAADVHTWPDRTDPTLVCTMALAYDGRVQTDPLLAHVAHRVTNRRRDGRRPLPQRTAMALVDACSAAGTHLQLLGSEADLDEVGELIGACDRLTVLDHHTHHDATHGYRWTPAEVEAHRYGIDVATLELTPAERAGLRLTQQWRVMESLGQFGGGRGLEDISRELIASASAVGLITAPGTTRDSYLRAGRGMQRMWLTASALRAAIQPMTGLPYLLARLEQGNGRGLTPATRSELRQLRPRFNALFRTEPGEAEAFLFRLADAGPPTARSLRRDVDEYLAIC